MSENNFKDNAKGCVGCLGILTASLCLIVIIIGFFQDLDAKPKNKIKEEIIKKGDEFSINNKELSKYIDVLEDLNLDYTTSKNGEKQPSRLIALPNRSAKYLLAFLF